MTTTKSQKIRIGMFVAVSLGLLAVILITFGGMKFWRGKTHYRIEFDGSVMGLEPGAPVHFNGIRVGTVEEIAISKTNLDRVSVSIEVDEGTPVRTDTKAMLQFAGITGMKVIDLRAGTLAAPRLADGGTIQQGETSLDKLERQAKDIADRSGQLMAKAQQMVDNLVEVTNPQLYKQTTENLAATSSELRAMVGENRVAIRQSIAAIRETAESATQVLDGEVVQLVTNAGDFVSQLKRLVSSNEGHLRSAVFDLRQASRSFKDLAREVRQRPSRLLFSGAASERKLP